MADARPTEEEEEQEERAAGKHLLSMQTLTEAERRTKAMILDEYKNLKLTSEVQPGWFRALIHLKRRLIVDDAGPLKEFREKVIEIMEKPTAEVVVLMLVLGDLIMVILEAVLDNVFDFHSLSHDAHGAHGKDYGEGHGEHHVGSDHEDSGHEASAAHAEGHRSDPASSTHEGSKLSHEENTKHGEDYAAEHVSPELHEGRNRRLRTVIRTVARPVIRRWVGNFGRLLKGASNEEVCDINLAYDISSACRIISITILFIFALEIVMKLVCAPKHFCKHIGHFLDAIVVGCSIVFEFTLHHSLGGLLIFFRSWRAVRIVHGLYEHIEYMHRALEIQLHLEKTLAIAARYKAYLHSQDLHKDYKTYKHLGLGESKLATEEEKVVTQDQKIKIAPTDHVSSEQSVSKNISASKMTSAGVTEDEEEKEEHVAGQLLLFMQTLTNEETKIRNMLDEYKFCKLPFEEQPGWFRALAHFKRRLSVEDDCPLKEFRERILKFMESPNVGVAVLILVLGDVLMVILEAVLDNVFDFHNHSHDTHGGLGEGHRDGHGARYVGSDAEDSAHEASAAHAEGHGADPNEENTKHGENRAAEHVNSELHEDGNRRLRMVIRTVARPVIKRWIGNLGRFLKGAAGEEVCDINLAYDIASTCRIISITILFMFALEIVIKLFCVPKHFCQHFGHIMDAIVVGCSIVFEFTLHHSLGGLLILFRSWRGVRIMHGLFEHIKYMHKALETKQHLETALARVNRYKEYLQSKNLRHDYKTYKHLSLGESKLLTAEEKVVTQEQEAKVASKDPGSAEQQNGGSTNSGSSAEQCGSRKVVSL